MTMQIGVTFGGQVALLNMVGGPVEDGGRFNLSPAQAEAAADLLAAELAEQPERDVISVVIQVQPKEDGEMRAIRYTAGRLDAFKMVDQLRYAARQARAHGQMG